MVLCRSLLLNILLTFTVAGADIGLVRDLYSDGLWRECRTEARRLLAVEPENFEARLLLAKAEKNSGVDTSSTFSALAADPEAPASIRLHARYEGALVLWRNGEYAAAAEAFREVFLHTQDSDLFLKAGCALTLALREHPMPWGGALGIGPQLRSTAPQWDTELIRSVQNEMAGKPAKVFNPGRYFISFYRSQIRPAIGARCTLYPSCSEYAEQALKTHGLWLGVPMIADRFVREPGVVSEADNPVLRRGRIYFADPLCDHDWWFNHSDGLQADYEK